MFESPLTADDDRLLDWVHGTKNVGSSSEVGLASSLYRACLRTLRLLSKQYVASRKPSRRNKSRIVESHARLGLFGDGLRHEGALEQCLKVDDELRDVLIGLLHRLGTTLLQGVERLYYAYDPIRTNEEIVSGLMDLVESTSAVISQQNEPPDEEFNCDNSESEDSEAGRDIKALNEEHILDALDTYTTSLMDLRPVLEQSLGDSLIPQARRAGVQPPEFHVTDSARPYVLQIHDKFRDAKTALVERLGEANWQRYIRLKNLAAAAENPVEGTAPEAVVAEIPKSAFRPISQFHDSGLGTSAPSRSQYAASNASHASFLSSATDSIKGKLRVPSTPVEVREGEVFTCFICARMLSGIRNRVSWKMHVFADLHPYICTFTDCPNLLTTYPTRQLWAEHELETHRSHEQYQCHDCSRVFSDETSFIDHLSNDHQHMNLNHTQLLATLSAARKSVPDPLDEQICPLCHQRTWTLWRDFATHLGRHLEEIALSSLPREDDGESSSSDESGTDVPGVSHLSQLITRDSARNMHKNFWEQPRGRLVSTAQPLPAEAAPITKPRGLPEYLTGIFDPKNQPRPSLDDQFFSFRNFLEESPEHGLPSTMLGPSGPRSRSINIDSVQDTNDMADLEPPDRKPEDREPTDREPAADEPLPHSRENAKHILRAWFEEHYDHPYPTDEDKQQLMQRTSWTSRMISDWLIDARLRAVKSSRQNRYRTRYQDRTGPPHSQELSVDSLFGEEGSPRWSLISDSAGAELKRSPKTGYNYPLPSQLDPVPPPDIVKIQRDKLKSKFPDTERDLANWDQNEGRKGVRQGLLTKGDWESHRHTIIQLYMHGTLDEVRQIMRTQHSFHATARMYKSRLKHWNARKHQTARRGMTMNQGPFEEPTPLPGNWPSNETPPSSTFAFSDSLETGTMPSPQPYHDVPGIGHENVDGALPDPFVSGQSSPDHPRSPPPRTA